MVVPPKMAAVRPAGVDYVVPNPLDDVEPPYCPHGPTCVFRRFFADKSPRPFYACAVHRTRKGCSFFRWSDESLPQAKREFYKSVYRDHQARITRPYKDGMAASLLKIYRDRRRYCHTCQVLYESEGSQIGCCGDVDPGDGHTGHNVNAGVSDHDLHHPTILLQPHSDNKGQAQYYFSEKTTSFLVSEFKRLNVSHVVCLGTPRLHEDLLQDGHIKSFLLDMDPRFLQFYSKDVFQRFSMFNGFFYCGEEGAHCLEKFLSSSTRVIVMVDPPFGGLISALKHGVKGIFSRITKRAEVRTILVYPYFNELQVLESFPTFNMLDYQVIYSNHHYFNEKGKRGKPSPARLYTDIPLPGLHLKESEGYKYCDRCNRYVTNTNIHCDSCNSCTSKDGRPYVHCTQCNRCVKRGYVHCAVCKRCELPDHSCDQTKSKGCHVCGEYGHKRRHCPSAKGLGISDGQSISRQDKKRKLKPNALSSKRKAKKRKMATS